MPVLRTETKTIPAETFETIIIGVPADEWGHMKWKRGISAMFLSIWTVALYVFYWFDLPSIDNMAGFARTIFGLDILNNVDSRDLWKVITFAIFGCLLLLVLSAIDKITNAEEDLLEKHGWDGKSPKRVELEYPQHFPHD